MRAGQLRDRITLRAFTSTNDDWNQPIEAWEDVATVWANVRFLNGKEFIAADREVSQATASIRIRWRQVDPTMRVLYRGTLYTITAVLPGPGRVYVDLAVRQA